jgi:L-threonylcarbamoyladenylate synthase
VESTVLDLSSSQPRILRYGGIPREDLEEVIGHVEDTSSGPDVKRSRNIIAGPDVLRSCDTSAPGLLSPGSLKGHYAPGTPLILHDPEELAVLRSRDGEGYLFFSGKNRDTLIGRNPGAPVVFILSETGSALEAAANLFEHLHRLDRLGLSAIHAETLPREGLGAAVNDRLIRASAGSRG